MKMSQETIRRVYHCGRT